MNHPVDLAVLGDVAETTRNLLAELTRRGHYPATWRSGELRSRIAAGSWRATPYDDAGTGVGTNARIDPRSLSYALDDLLPTERTLVVDSGHFMGWAPMYLRVPRRAGFVFTQGFQSIGLGLATAVGAALARPDRLTVAAVGDEGLLTLPCGGIIRIRFKGTLSPAPHVSTRCAGPLTLGSQGTAIAAALQSAPLNGPRGRSATGTGGGSSGRRLTPRPEAYILLTGQLSIKP